MSANYCQSCGAPFRDHTAPCYGGGFAVGAILEDKDERIAELEAEVERLKAELLVRCERCGLNPAAWKRRDGRRA